MEIPQSIMGVLERGGLVVAANARAARDLRRLYAAHCIDRGLKAWASPAIYEWHGWLASEWQRLLLSGNETRLLLTALQEEFLWRTIVLPELRPRTLVSPGEMARLAQQAYARLAQYGGLAMLGRGEWDVRSPEYELQEPELFRRWAVEFERRCKRNGWLSAGLLPNEVSLAYRSKQISAPPEVAWSGFDRVSPAEAEVRAALHAAGCVQTQIRWAMQASQKKIAAQSPDDEIEACAAWVREYVARHAGARVGVLVQDVTRVRAQMDRVFRRVLMPESAGLLAVEAKPVYEFTLGLPLGDVPMVRAALLLLRWMAKPVEQDKIRWLMTTGFVGDAEEADALAVANRQLRQEALLSPEEGMDAFLRRLQRLGDFRWAMRLRRAKAELGLARGKERSCCQWVTAANAALATAGWPGMRTEDSVSFLMRERWEKVLEDVASLDFSERRVPCDDFLDSLTGHARGTIFSVEREGVPVSISGVLESAGRSFDAVWMLGMTGDAWPARSAAHPLLPLWLQKEFSMPRGDATEDRALSVAVMERLRDSAEEVVVSYAREGEAGAQRPSSLIAEIAENMGPPLTRSVKSRLRTEEFTDDANVEWPEGQLVRGGQGVLKSQAACPFQAFAATRLTGANERAAEHGLNAAQRGNVLHMVLQAVWEDARVRTSAALRDLIASHELEILVARHVQQSLSSYTAETGSWKAAYLALEEQQICKLTLDWLGKEAGRRAFAVDAVERTQEIEIEGLRLNVRIDRIDRLEEGGRVLIDYKTSEVSRAMWEGERPDEPQLPLYAVAGNVEDLRGVSFAQLRPGDLKFVSTLETNDAGLTKPLSGQADEDFAARRAEWRRTLSSLSRDFQSGIATVDPKNYPETCKYCELSGLCRVAETQLASADEEADGDEGA